MPLEPYLSLLRNTKHHHSTPQQEPVATRNQGHDQGHSARLPFSAAAPGVATSPAAAAAPAAAAPASPRAKPTLPTTKRAVVVAQANAKGRLKLEQRKERPMEKGAPDNAGSDIGASAGIPDGGPTASVPRSKCAIQWDSNQSAESFIPSPDDLDDLPWAEARGGDNSPSPLLQPFSLSTATATANETKAASDTRSWQKLLTARTNLVAAAQHSVSTLQGHAIHNQAVEPPPSTLQERFAELTARNYLELKEHTRHDYSPVPSPSAATGQQPLPNVGTTPLPPLPPLPPSLPPLSSLLLLPSLPSLPQPPLTAMMVACVCTTAQAQRRVSHACREPTADATVRP